jgi:dipeptidyl aminopeptidase/acylaminoacyl peptidase
MFVAFVIWPVPPPVLVDSVQLTHDGYAKRGALFTDGEFIYFIEVRNGVNTLVRVPQAGGDPVAMPAPPVPMLPVDYSPSRREILALEEGGTAGASPLWVFDLPAGPFRRLGDLTATAATWSSQGESVFFARDNRLYVAGADGRDTRELLALPGRILDLRHSPDGRLLRFVVQQEKGAQEDLWELRTNGARLRRLPLPGDITGRLYLGSWSPDSGYFFFHEADAERESLWIVVKPRNPYGADSIARLNTGLLNVRDISAAGNGIRFFGFGNIDRVELLRYNTNSTGLVPFLSGVSADGLAFSRQADRVVFTTFPERALVVCRLDGSDRRQLAGGSQIALLPVWSPDGKRIAYMQRTASGHWKIHIVPSDGGVAEELLPGSEDEGNPAWAPDGNSLIYAGVPWLKGFAPNSTAIHHLDLRTRKDETLPGSQGLWAPRWSPDGKFLVAEKTDSQNLMLYEFSTNTWRPLAKAEGPENIGYTCWSRDSRYIYYNTYSEQHGKIYRVDIMRGVSEPVGLPGELSSAVTLGQWFTLAPDDSIVMLRDTSIHELFALDIRFP